MKISISSIAALNKRYGLSNDVSKIGVDKLVGLIGSQLGEVEETMNLSDKYRNIVIVKVVDCHKHPNADKLNICLIDDGGVTKKIDRNKDGLIQVVCGAPNVKSGIMVAWLPPGATVPDTFDSEPFILGARELRGVMSNGMLASPKELALGDSHDGILVLSGSIEPGTDFAKHFGLDGDTIIDIENKMFTHRPDCFGLLGVYRELAGIQKFAFTSPDWYTPKPVFPKPSGEKLNLSITNEIPKLCPRFSAIVISDVKVEASPIWLQVELAKVGTKSINNIVDYTNYFSYLTGQPLHAYDYDKVAKLSGGKSASIVIRKPHAKECIALLNGKTIEPSKDLIMIATDKEPLGIAGVMGGSQSEVDNTTKNIILESASFDMYAIRRASMSNGLFTDAVTRFSKGQSPLQTLTVLARITNEICDHAGGKVASQVYDHHSLPKNIEASHSLHPAISISTEFINSRLGLALTSAEIAKILTNVEFDVSGKADNLVVAAPFWRTDIELPEDVVEEVGRLHGYDNASLLLPQRSTKPAAQNQLLELKSQARTIMHRAGANEVLNYSFVHGNIITQSDQDVLLAYKLSNAISPNLQYYRLSIVPSLLDKIHPNIKAGYDHFAVYEIGKAHNVQHIESNGLPSETEALGFVLAANSKLKIPGAAYYQARQYLDNLARSLQIDLELQPLSSKENSQLSQPFDKGRSATILIKNTKVPIGVIGEFKPNVTRSFKLPVYSAGFEIDLEELLTAASNAPSSYSPLPKFPKVTQDITLKASATTSYQKIYNELDSQISNARIDNSYLTLSPISIYQASPTDKHKNYTFRIEIASYERTLTDKEINKMLDSVVAKLKNNLDVSRV